MFKQYTHKIEGVDTDVLYFIAPNGTVFRSKKKIKNNYSKLELSRNDLQKILDFKPEDSHQARTLESPDENWVFDPQSVPEGWKMKKYTFNSGSTNKTEEVYHYLTPDNTIVRGKRQVHDWMLKMDVTIVKTTAFFILTRTRRKMEVGLEGQVLSTGANGYQPKIFQQDG